MPKSLSEALSTSLVFRFLVLLLFAACFLDEVAWAQTPTLLTDIVSYSAENFDKVNSPVYYVCSDFSASTCTEDGGSYSGDTVLYLLDADSGSSTLSSNNDFCSSGSKISNYNPPISCKRVYMRMACYALKSCSATVKVQYYGFVTPTVSPTVAPSGPSPAPSAVPAQSDDERSALMAIFNSMGGQNWDYNGGWASTSSIKTWYGVTVGTSNRVTELDLSNNNLKGTLPSMISVFSKLTKFILDYNHLSGTIGSEIGLLTDLKVLSFSNNSLAGTGICRSILIIINIYCMT